MKWIIIVSKKIMYLMFRRCIRSVVKAKRGNVSDVLLKFPLAGASYILACRYSVTLDRLLKQWKLKKQLSRYLIFLMN